MGGTILIISYSFVNLIMYDCNILFPVLQKLVKPGRVLVGEGVLTKLCRKKAKLRQFYLFNDLLIYGNIVLEKKKFNKQHVLPLENVKLQSLENDGGTCTM